MLKLNSGDSKVNKEIESTVLYLTYLHTQILPTVDELLDWRLRLDEMKIKGEFPVEWFDREIMATDYLLSLNNQKINNENE